MAGNGLYGGAPVPTPRPMFESELTPGQRTGLDYSRDHYRNGTYMVQPNGDVTSFMGLIHEAPGGGYINYPGYWDGRVMQLPNGKPDYQGALAKALQYEQATGRQFARYPTLDEALANEAQVHGLMDQDMAAVMQTPGYAAKLRALRK